MATVETLVNGFNFLPLKEQATPPAAPAAGNRRFWVDTAGKLWLIDSTGLASPASPMDAEGVRDTIAAALVAGSNTTVTVNDAADTITLSSTDDPEFIRDTIAAALAAGANVTITTDDPANTITIAATGGGGGGVVGQMTELRLTANQSITGGSWTKIAWNSETLDELGAHDNVTNNTRVTVAAAGTYDVKFFASSTGGSGMYMTLYKNGTFYPSRNTPGSEGVLPQMMRLAAGDYIEAGYYSSASCTIVANTGDSVTKLTVTRIA